MSSSKAIPTFSGTKLDYPSFRKAILSYASSLENELDANGLIGDILPDAEFYGLLLTQQQQVAQLGGSSYSPSGSYTRLRDPGPRPQLGSEKLTRDSVAIHNAYLGEWNYKFDRFAKQAKARNLLKTEIINALDANTARRLSHPHHGFQQLTAADIFADLDATFGVATAADLEANRAALAVPFVVSGDFDAFVQTHVDAHLFAERSKQPFSEADKVAAFRRALGPSKIFERKMFTYFDAHPAVHQQTFLGLADAMLVEWRDRPKTAAAVVSNPAASASAVTTEEPDMVALRAEMKTLKATLSKMSNVGGKQKTERREDLYCWTHGTKCNHSSDQCRFPATGHVTTATAGNMAGGKSDPFERRERKDRKGGKGDTK